MISNFIKEKKAWDIPEYPIATWIKFWDQESQHDEPSIIPGSRNPGIGISKNPRSKI
jgi:hypothetical protein